MSTDLQKQKTGIEIIPAAFTDHDAVALRITIDDYDLQRRRGRWKMDPMLMADEHLQRRIRTEWVKWQKHKRYYPGITMWWERYVKKHVQILIRKEQSDRNTDYKFMESHLYQCIYDILHSDAPEAVKLPALQRYKAKIVRLHAMRMEKVLLDNTADDKMDGEEPTFFHILKIVKRRESRAVHHVQDQQGNIVTRHSDVLNTFVTHIRRKYGPIVIDSLCVAKMRNAVHPHVHQNTPISLKSRSPQRKSSLHCERVHGTKCLASTASAWSFTQPTGRRYIPTF
jgi:hypothetical protein